MLRSKQGLPTPPAIREKIVELFLAGMSYADIAKRVGVTKSTAYNICKKFTSTGDIERGTGGPPECVKVTDNVLQHIELYKQTKPSIYLKEIRRKLIAENVCTVDTVPCLSTIHGAITKYLGMSRKKLTSVAAESMTERNVEWTLDFMDIVTNYDVEQLHWFDESSVIRTTGNRVYGHAERGKPAVEIQRHASNANYTVNLLVSASGIDYADITEGPSNGFEMINFFEEAVRTVDAFGNPVLSEGDCVILDNCGFHHGRHAEPVLRELLRRQGVELLFQPPYSPQFNVCELCFRYLKVYLKGNEEYTYNFTELAIADALSNIGQGACRQFAFDCGYV